mmetsp:Transcript_17897/g.46274  ORF Transcript_17897/g.46274 Transcript_17897/m.46274 type:complete len:250 (-) Transcript_17897:3-752(-)
MFQQRLCTTGHADTGKLPQDLANTLRQPPRAWLADAHLEKEGAEAKVRETRMCPRPSDLAQSIPQNQGVHGREAAAEVPQHRTAIGLAGREEAACIGLHIGDDVSILPLSALPHRSPVLAAVVDPRDALEPVECAELRLGQVDDRAQCNLTLQRNQCRNSAFGAVFVVCPSPVRPSECQHIIAHPRREASEAWVLQTAAQLPDAVGSEAEGREDALTTRRRPLGGGGHGGTAVKGEQSRVAHALSKGLP